MAILPNTRLDIIFACQLSKDETARFFSQYEDRTVLSLGAILLVGHPGPHDLAGVGFVILAWGIREGRQSQGRDVIDHGDLARPGEFGTRAHRQRGAGSG